MAALSCKALSGAVAVSSASAKTALQLEAPTNQALVVRAFGLSFSGTTSTDPRATVRLVRQSTAGTMTTVAAAVVNGRPETPRSIVRANATVEPTAGTPLDVQLTAPVAPLRIAFTAPIVLSAGERLGIEVQLGTGSGTVHAYLEYEE